MTEVIRPENAEISKESLMPYLGKPVVIFNSKTGLDYGVFTGFVDGTIDGVALEVDGNKGLTRITPTEGLDVVQDLEYEVLGEWPDFYSTITNFIDELRDYRGFNSGALTTNTQGYFDALKLIAAESRNYSGREIWNSIIGSLNLAEQWMNQVTSYRLSEPEATQIWHQTERQILRLRELSVFMVETNGGAYRNSAGLEDLHAQLRTEKLARFALRAMRDDFYRDLQNGETLVHLRDER
jgi:hypothetical protein